MNQSTKFYFEDQIRNCLVKIHFGSQDRVDSYKVGIIEGVLKNDQNCYILKVKVNPDEVWEVDIKSVSNKDMNEREAFILTENFDEMIDKKWVALYSQQISNFDNYQMTTDDNVRILRK